MTKRAETLQDRLDYDPVPQDEDVSTSHLDSGLLAPGPNLAYDNIMSTDEETELSERPNTDWRSVLAAQPEYSEAFDDSLPEPPPKPSGMALHSVPSRIGLTFWARLATGIRRGTLLVVVSALAVGILAAGVYALSSTSWLSSLITAPAPAGVSQPPSPDNASADKPGTSQAANAPQPQQAQAQAADKPPTGGQDSVSGAAEAGNVKSLLESGIAQYKLGNYDKAIDLLQTAVDSNGGDAVTYYQLGLAYMAAYGREHALDDAEMAFRTAISLQPSWAAPHQLLAENLIRRGYFVSGIEPAKQAVQLEPNQAESWRTLARAYRGAGREAEAKTAEAEAARR